MFDLAKLRAPYHYLAYAGAGYLHLRRRDLRAALEEFVQARRLNPLDRKLAVEAARIALELEDYPEALRHAIDALLASQGLGEGEVSAARRPGRHPGCPLPPVQRRAGRPARPARRRPSARQRPSRPHPRPAFLEPDHVGRPRPARRYSAEARGAAASGDGPAPLPGLPALLRRPPRAARPDRGREAFGHATALVREGQEDRDIFIVLAGRLQESRRTPVGTQILAQPALGEFLGEISYIDGKPRYSTVLGADAGTVLRFPAAELDQLAHGNREIGVALLWSFWHSLAAKVRAPTAS